MSGHFSTKFPLLESHLLLYVRFAIINDETILHLFYECDITKALWKSLILFFNKSLNLPFLSPQTVFLRFTDTYCNDILFKNHILYYYSKFMYTIQENMKKFH